MLAGGATYQAFGILAYDYEVDLRLVLGVGGHLSSYEVESVLMYG